MANPNTIIRLPSWFTEEIIIPFKAGISHTFLLHGDINGLVFNPNYEEKSDRLFIPLRKFLEEILDERDMVIFYNIASGLCFFNKEMEKTFKKIIGVDIKENAIKDPIVAAKAGLAAKMELPRDPDTCLKLMEKVLKELKNVAVVIYSIHFVAPLTSGGSVVLPNERVNIERLKNWSHDENIRANNSIIVMITDQASKVSAELLQSGNGIQVVFISKPDKENRKIFAQSLFDEAKKISDTELRLKKLRIKLKKTKSENRKNIEAEIINIENLLNQRVVKFNIPKDFNLDVFAHITQGMNLQQILDLFLHSQKTGKPLDFDYVKDKKREILNTEYGDLMEIVEPKNGLEDIGGLEYVKAYLKSLLEAIQKGEERLVSMGVTLMGPPGTGKTAIVEALAKEAGFNFVKTKNIRSMWVGESEERMQRFIYGLRSLAPVVVMNDEADLADAQRDALKGDSSGISERLMKMWMEVLSDPRIRGKIVVISCTNRPDRIDAALKRSGRSDDRILIPMPSCSELPAIFKVMFRRHKIQTDIIDFSFFAKLTEGLSGADIEKIVLNAYRFAFEKGENKVNDSMLKESISDFIPSASQFEIDRMTLMGVLECSSKRLLPPNIKEIIEKIKNRNLIENLQNILEQIRSRNIIEID